MATETKEPWQLWEERYPNVEKLHVYLNHHSGGPGVAGVTSRKLLELLEKEFDLPKIDKQCEKLLADMPLCTAFYNAQADSWDEDDNDLLKVFGQRRFEPFRDIHKVSQRIYELEGEFDDEEDYSEED